MLRTRDAFLVAAVVLVLASSGSAQGGGPERAASRPAASDDLIASRYLGDVVIEKDPDVLFAEGFEADPLPVAPWEKPGGFYDLKGHPARLHPTDREAAVGTRSLELVHPSGSTSPQWMHRRFAGSDTVYTRFYRKFAADWTWAPMGCHDTYLFAGEFKSPTTTDLTLYLDISSLDLGFNRRLCQDDSIRTRQPLLILRSALQGPEGQPAGLDFGLHREIVVGDDFKYYYALPFGRGAASATHAAPDALEAGRWYCFETMAKLNSTPEAKDGEIRLWVDGVLMTELTGLTLRNAAHRMIQWDHWMLGPRYGGKNFQGGPPHEQKSWIDGLVLAKRRVGPARR